MSVKEKMLEILEGIDIRFKEPLKTYTRSSGLSSFATQSL